jgi:hypothetical protein
MYAEITVRRSAHPLLLHLACALSLLLPMACALTDATVVLPKARLAPSIETGRRRQVIVTTPFQDAREIRQRCGMKKNSYDMDTADLQCTTYIEGYRVAARPALWLANLLEEELRRAGFAVVNESEARASAVRIEGSLLKLFIEPVIKFWTVDMEADLQVRLVATSETGLHAERSFFVKGVKSQYVMSTLPFDVALADATTAMLRDLVKAIVELLDRYPQLGSGRPQNGVIRVAVHSGASQ